MAEKMNIRWSIIWILVVLGVGLAGCGKSPVRAPKYDDSLEPAQKVEIFCIVDNIDDVNQKISLKAVSFATEYILSYTGGTDIRDKYGDIISVSQITPGTIVDAVYDKTRDKLLSMKISDNPDVLQLNHISGATIDYEEDTVTFNHQTYQMAKNISAYSDNHKIGLDEICSEDELTVWLYNNTVCTIFVELGHGYVRLSDYETYMGGTVEIGYAVKLPVSEDMLITVREGDYKLRIMKDDDEGTKDITVLKNQEVRVSLADIAIEPKQMGSVLFNVSPADASVYIDGRLVNTEGSIELEYGKHKLYIIKEGYETYSASFNVNYAYKVKEYVLKETDATTAATESKTENGTTQGASTTEKSTEKEKDDEDDPTKNGEKTNNKVTVSAPIGATVYFDGEYMGNAPISFTKVTGSHIITLSMTGYLAKSYSVTFTDDGKDKDLKYDPLVSIASLIE